MQAMRPVPSHSNDLNTKTLTQGNRRTFKRMEVIKMFYQYSIGSTTPARSKPRSRSAQLSHSPQARSSLL